MAAQVLRNPCPGATGIRAQVTPERVPKCGRNTHGRHADGLRSLDRRSASAWPAHFRTLLKVAGVKLLRLPSRSPNLNAYAERFVRWIKHECFRHIIPLGERHLRAALRDFVDHYHAERNHQDLGNVIPFPSRDSASRVGRIGRRERLGGVLSFYERNAA